MKLRTKTGEAVFTVTHPQSGQTWTIKPEEYLKSHQVMKMITKPDLILHFAHYLAEEKRREGYENVEVRARVMVSLNGREPQLLIDPNVDLAKEEVGLLPARWIVPLTTPLRAPNIAKLAADSELIKRGRTRVQRRAATEGRPNSTFRGAQWLKDRARFVELVKRLEDIRERPVALRNAAANRRSKALARATAIVARH